MFGSNRLKKKKDRGEGPRGSPYTMKTLQPEEKVVYVARFHWIYTFKALLPLLGALAVFLIAAAMGLVLPFLLVLVLPILFAFVHLMNKLTYRFVNRVIVTNKRLIIQKGWTSRNTTDLGLDRILGYKIAEDASGRALKYGQVILFGAGVGQIDLHPFMAETTRLCMALNKEQPPPTDQKPEKKTRWLFRPFVRKFAQR
ncbi:MAG: PH domain-containing protein [Rhizobiales bacterium]|nr:PH domain-containing protein [Hyphomicrobiales bacterium]